MKKNILFVSHDASRTGAPMVLKHFIGWLKGQQDIEFSILLKKGGDLQAEFEQLGRVYVWRNDLRRESFLGKVQTQLSFRLFKKPLYQKYPAQLKAKKFDLIYLNTVASTDLLPELKAHHNCPVILHVHENEYSIKAFYADSLSADRLKLIDHYIAVSESTKQNLVDNFGITSEKISIVNEFVPVKNMPAPTLSAQKIKESLRIKDEFIVGASGPTSWRKGADIFVQVALMVSKNLPGKVKFVWVGEVESPFKFQLEYELKRIGLIETDIIFTGAVTNPQDYFQTFDVFALTSREDPLPLVALEAAALSKPIICFADSGGIPELLNSGEGIIVPYADAEAMAAAIIGFYNDSEKLSQLGTAAKNIVQQFDVAVQAPKVLAVINTL